MKRRYLIGIMVQQRWIEIDDDDTAVELISQPGAVAASGVREYIDRLLALADKSKRGSAETTPDDNRPAAAD